MKRYIAGLACVATAVLSAPALASTAHAQAVDPITALKSQFSNGRGVSFVDTTKIQGPQGNAIIAQRKGAFQFGASGVNASDQTAKLRFKESDFEGAFGDGEGDEESRKMIAGLTKPERVIRIKNTTYISGGILGEYLPSDKTWVRVPAGMLGMTGPLSQSVNVAEPATLKALLAHATKRGGVYSGKITFGELSKVSPWFRASMAGASTARTAKRVVTWKLYLGSDQLAERLTTTFSMGSGDEATPMTVDTRYTGWGARITVKAPPAEEVAEMKDLGEEAEEATSIPLLGG
ncbi:hypothetical protein ACQPYK_06700 [Streptosporangium sp. CA-135522]|uniref:hypothetical protein n=1 Tax=Streptosporangium sp. CA-135522 TaxID=3240072 RepID=UPI003D8AD77D